MMKLSWVRCAILVCVAGLVGYQDASSQSSQNVHPTKAAFADAETWPAVAPGQIPLRNFEPFRAVYARVYRDGKGQQREDRVIITAERVAWGETGAIMVTLIDAGNLDYDDTSARVHTRVFAEADQRLLFQVSPVPGTAKDYLLIHADQGPVRVTRVQAATGEGTVEAPPVPTPQLGAPALWVVGSMALQGGQRIRFSAADAPAASNILGARHFQVSGQETIESGPDGQHDAWVVSYPLGLANARVMQNFVIDRPPYLLGKRPMDLDSGETTEIGTLRLIEFSTFGGR